MPQRSVVAVGASLLVASLALAGCGTRDDSGSDASGSNAIQYKVAKIGVIAPLSGDLLPSARESRTRSTWRSSRRTRAARPELDARARARDDQATPDVGQHAASAAFRRRRHRCRGTPNSSVAQSVAPVLASAGSRWCPRPTRTRPSPWARLDDRPTARLPDLLPYRHDRLVQGPFAAPLPIRRAGLKEVATVHDQKTYRPGLVAAFPRSSRTWAERSSRPRRSTPTRRTTRRSSRGQPTNPEAVYYGGEYPQAGPLSPQMGSRPQRPAHGWRRHLLPWFIELGGATSGDLATSVGAPTDDPPVGPPSSRRTRRRASPSPTRPTVR